MNLTLAPCSLGTDIVNSDRFTHSRHLHKYINRFGVLGNSAKDVAKTWACLEAIIKAEPRSFDPTDITICFPKNSAPVVIDPSRILQYQYQLSVSHEGSMVIAVALGTLIIDQD